MSSSVLAWLQSLSTSLARGPRSRSGRKRSLFCPEWPPEPSPRSLAAPNPCLASPHAFVSCPASLASFLKQLAGAPPLSPCSASQLLSCAAPPAPSCPPTASPPTPHIGTGFPGPLWLGPFRVCLVPCPNQQLQVPTFPSHSHKVAIVHCTKEDHPVFMHRGGRRFTQGHRHHLHAPSRHHMSHASQTHTSQRPTWCL